MTVKDWRDDHYATMYDRSQRDPIQRSFGRAAMPLGRRWHRCNPDGELIWVDDIDGRPVALTRKQTNVYQELLTYIGQSFTVREIAASLGYAPSTVSRAIWKLQAFGIIAAVIGRGRYAGSWVLQRVSKLDGLEAFRRAAKAKVAEWRKAAEARVLRTKLIVAPLALEGGRGIDSLYYYFIGSMAATMTAPWTPEDMAEIV